MCVRVTRFSVNTINAIQRKYFLIFESIVLFCSLALVPAPPSLPYSLFVSPHAVSLSVASQCLQLSDWCASFPFLENNNKFSKCHQRNCQRLLIPFRVYLWGHDILIPFVPSLIPHSQFGGQMELSLLLSSSLFFIASTLSTP